MIPHEVFFCLFQSKACKDIEGVESKRIFLTPVHLVQVGFLVISFINRHPETQEAALMFNGGFFKELRCVREEVILLFFCTL